MVIEPIVKDLYKLALKYKEDMSKYTDMNSFNITMDMIRNTIFDVSIMPTVWQTPVYTARQQMYFTLEMTPLKTLDYIDIEFAIEKNKNGV